MDEQTNPWRVKTKQVVYENPWIKVSHEEVITPAGTDGIYGTVHFKNYAIGIIPLDEDNNTWLIGQYRYALNEYSWEIVEGGGKVEEDPLAAAKRELQEEAGLAAEEWTKIAVFNTSNSVTDEVAIIYVARKLSQVPQQPDDTELLQVKKIPFAEVIEMVMNNTIKDSLTIIGVLKLQLLLKQGAI